MVGTTLGPHERPGSSDELERFAEAHGELLAELACGRRIVAVLGDDLLRSAERSTVVVVVYQQRGNALAVPRQLHGLVTSLFDEPRDFGRQGVDLDSHNSSIVEIVVYNIIKIVKKQYSAVGF